MAEFNKYHLLPLSADEQILRVLHRNWFYLLEQFIFLIVIALALFGGFFLFPYFIPDLQESPWDKLLPFIQSLAMLMLWVYGYMLWIDYYFDVWIITTERIINIEQKGLFTRSVSELTYEKIQDVSSEVKGFLPTMFNFGDILVQTAGEQNKFIFRTISDPYQVKSLIARELEKHQAK